MTVSVVPTWVQTPGNGSATVYSFPFLITATTDVVVGFITGGVYLQQVSGFTVSFTVSIQGGQVNFATPPPVGTTVDIRSAIPQTQPTNFANLGGYFPETTTNSLDRETRLTNDLYRLTYQFGIHGPDYEGVTWPALPPPPQRLGTQLIFDSVTGLPGVGALLPAVLTQSQFNGYLGSSNLLTLIYPITQAEINAGAVIVNEQFPPLCVDRYFDNLGLGTDSALAFSIAWKVAQASFGGVITFGATAPYYTYSPINFTTTLNAPCYPCTLVGPGLSVEFATQTIVAIHGGNTWNHVFDLTGTLGLVMQGVSIGTLLTGSVFPTTGIFQARGPSGQSVGICKFYNCSILGNFTVACYYNFAAEDCEHYGMHLYQNYQGGPCWARYITAHNTALLTSIYQPVFGGGAIQSASCLTHRWFGGEVINASNFSADTAFNSGSDCTYLDLVGGYRTWGELSFAIGAGGIRSNNYIDCTYGPSSQCRIDSFRTDTANNANYGFRFSGAAAGSHSEWQFDNIFTTTNIAAIQGDSNQTMLNWRVGQWTEQPARGFKWPGGATTTYFTSGEVALNLGTANFGCVWIGDTQQLTIGSGTMTTLNSRAGQQQGWGTPLHALVIPNLDPTTVTVQQLGQAFNALNLYLMSRGDTGA